MCRLSWKLLVPLMFGVSVLAWTVHFVRHPVFTLTSCLDIYHVETPNLIPNAIGNALLQSVIGVGFAVLLFGAVSRRFRMLPYPPIVSAPASVLASHLVGVLVSISLEWLDSRSVLPIYIGHGLPYGAGLTSLVSSMIFGMLWPAAGRGTGPLPQGPSFREMLGDQSPWYTAGPDLLLSTVLRYSQMKILALPVQLRYILIYVLATMPLIMGFYIVFHGVVYIPRSFYSTMFGFGIGTAVAYALPVMAGRPLSRIRTAAISLLVSFLAAVAIVPAGHGDYLIMTLEAAFFGSIRLFPEEIPQ